MRVVVSAPGRVCLFGEHMDWCGHSVIPAAIEARMYVEASPLSGHIAEVRSYRPFQTKAVFDLRDIKIDPSSDLRYVGAVLKEMLLENMLTSEDALAIGLLKGNDVAKNASAMEPRRRFDDLPIKVGLSSSAALCVSVAAASHLLTRFIEANQSAPDRLRKNLETTLGDNLARYANIAYIGERKVLGVNCGQMDQYASAYGGILSIDCGREPAELHRLNMKGDISLVVGDTGQPKDTPRILAWLGERFQKKEKLFMEGVEGIVRVVSDAREELERESPDLRRVGELMNQNQRFIQRNLKVSGDCPISPSNLDKLVNAALDGGALGAKVSGSGGGGCVVALCDSEAGRREVSEAIEKAHGKAYSTIITPNGLRVELAES